MISSFTSVACKVQNVQNTLLYARLQLVAYFFHNYFYLTKINMDKCLFIKWFLNLRVVILYLTFYKDTKVNFFIFIL